ncbi:unnamed protein product [Aphis gossypii]|uniref:Uncharacterized protein n=1 Tax=Aphis gossypii TaxID=80765 RepID=A0A9P0IYN2_APHGO|nr:unnamed protein product [Aphis gossypii]
MLLLLILSIHSDFSCTVYIFVSYTDNHRRCVIFVYQHERRHTRVVFIFFYSSYFSNKCKQGVCYYYFVYIIMYYVPRRAILRKFVFLLPIFFFVFVPLLSSPRDLPIWFSIHSGRPAADATVIRHYS